MAFTTAMFPTNAYKPVILGLTLIPVRVYLISSITSKLSSDPMAKYVCETAKILGVVVNEYGSNVLTTKRKCESSVRLDGKVVVITGANAGIGKETALELSLRGAKVYIGCRNMEKAKKAIEDILSSNPSADITPLEIDLSSLKSVRQFVNRLQERESQIDILVNNAGIMGNTQPRTADGFEMTFGTNYLGPFLLTMLLLPSLRRAPKARIVNVSAALYTVGKIDFDNFNKEKVGDYNQMLAYCDSKLAQIVWTRELAQRLPKDSSVTVYALHPGVIKTELTRNSNISDIHKNLFLLSPQIGCQTTLYCALEESLDNESGHYYDNCRRVEKLAKNALDEQTGRKLWELSCDLVGLENDLRLQ